MEAPPTADPMTAQWSEDPDVALMLRVQADDSAAFAELIHRYRARIQGRIVKRLGDHEEAEDLTQEVFLRLFRHRKRYRPTARLSTWLYHIAHNVTCNAVRARLNRTARSVPDRSAPTPRPSLLQDKTNGPSESMERSEAALIVRAAVQSLANRQRTAVELFQFQNHSYAEVAAELAMTPKAAKSLLYRARGQLRSALSGYMTSHS
jgi:RNA polymerase sigma-70 factor (ECF subfamily)